METKRKIFGTLCQDEFGFFIYCCSECSIEYKTGNELEKHVQIHKVGLAETNCIKADPDTDQNSCLPTSEMDLLTSSSYNITKHLTTNGEDIGNKQNRFPSPLDFSHSENELSPCDYLLDDPVKIESNETKPRKSKHRPSGTFMCDICKSVFKQKHSIVQHMVSHWSTLPKCDICGKSFKNLKSHMRNHYTDRQFKCKVCDAHFVHSSYLNVHMRKHTGETPFVCSECGHTFTARNKLTFHMKKHSGLLPFKCAYEQCDRAYREKFMLQRHIRAAHKNIRPHNCSICSASFRSTKTMRQHMNLHGEKRFACRCCDKRFSQGAGRRGHEKRVHGII